jgi:hypothetical protein
MNYESHNLRTAELCNCCEPNWFLWILEGELRHEGKSISKLQMDTELKQEYWFEK